MRFALMVAASLLFGLVFMAVGLALIGVGVLSGVFFLPGLGLGLIVCGIGAFPLSRLLRYRVVTAPVPRV